MWLERPSKLSKHRQTTYYIPAELQKRLGVDTYTLKVGERLYGDQHHSQMKPPLPDPRCKHVEFDYADREVDKDDAFTEEQEYNASKIVGYRPVPDVPWGYEFKT